MNYAEKPNLLKRRQVWGDGLDIINVYALGRVDASFVANIHTHLRSKATFLKPGTSLNPVIYLKLEHTVCNYQHGRISCSRSSPPWLSLGFQPIRQ